MNLLGVAEDLSDELETARLTVRSVDGDSEYWVGVLRRVDASEPYRLTNDAAATTALLRSGLTTVRLYFQRDAIEVDESDEIGVADAVAATAEYGEDQAEGIGVADAVAARAEYDEDQAEGIGVADSVRAGLLLSADDSDEVGVADSVTSVRLFGQAEAPDEVGVADAVAARAEYDEDQAEGIGVADSVRATLDQVGGATEGIGVADSVRASRLLAAEASDEIGVADSADARAEYDEDQAEGIGVADSVRATRRLSSRASEEIGVADSVSATLRTATPAERKEAAEKLYLRSLRALKPAVFVAAIEVSHPMAATPLRVVMDGRDRQIGGETFSRASISAKLQDEKANQAPRAELSIVYVGADLRRFMNAHNGGEGATVRYMEVAPDGTVAYERDFEVLRGTLTDTGATWEVGSYFNLDRPLVQAHYTAKTAPALFRL